MEELLEIAAFLSPKELFRYLDATPSSRCVNEGQAVLNAKHIITCGITAKVVDQLKIFAICLQTSALKQKPHEIKGTLSIADPAEIRVEEFLCSCKAGRSTRCKHIAAVLYLCSRTNILELPMLSSTDLKCYWKKSRAESVYKAGPLLDEPCLAPKVSPPPKVLSTDEINNIRDLYASLRKATALGKHRLGRRNNLENRVSLERLAYLDKVLSNCSNLNLLDQLPTPRFQSDCCQNIYDSLCNVDVENTATVTLRDRDAWAMERKFRITGSRCYSIFTYSLNEWEVKAMKYFGPKSFKSKYTDHGIAHESAARTAYIKSNGYRVVETGVIVCQKQPWLAYTPDGIVFKDGKPFKLIEIKCPYSGKQMSAINFAKECKYLTFANNRLALKKKHTYYAQVQLGMSILNLSECDLILYSSYSKNFLNIVVKYDEPYAKMLLERLHYNYFVNMLHIICKNKNTL